MSGEHSVTPPSDGDNPVVVYRTNALHETDIVAEALGRAQIPFIRRVEILGGLSAAMPANPPIVEILGGVIFCALAVYSFLRHAPVMGSFWLLVAGLLFGRAWNRRRSKT